MLILFPQLDAPWREKDMMANDYMLLLYPLRDLAELRARLQGGVR